MNYMDQYKFWLEDSYFDEGTKEELRKIADNQAEIEDRFYKDLAFGTGGLRGVIGAGTNRMNIYTVRKATQGLANYILKQGGADKGVAIAYDSRYYSPEFADEAALCMAANGIKAYVFDELRPTPELSFALRTLGCISGIVVTASHNPPEYNGYKVYWEDGAQVTAPKDHEIIDEVEHVTDFHTVKTMSKDDAIEAGLYQYIGEEIDVAYMEELKKQIIHPEIIKEVADELKIVYTPFHGDHHGVRHHLNGDEQDVRLRGCRPLREPPLTAAKLHPQLPRLRHQLPPVALMCIRIPDQLCGTALHPGDQILLFSHPHRKNLRRSYFFIV